MINDPTIENGQPAESEVTHAIPAEVMQTAIAAAIRPIGYVDVEDDLVEIPKGVFDDLTDEDYGTYRATLQFHNRILGGIPKDPEIIESWLRAKFAGKESERRSLALQTMRDQGYDVGEEEMSYADITVAAANMANLKQTQGFKRDSTGLFIEARQVKAALREAINVVLGDVPVKIRETKANKDGESRPVTKMQKSVFVERVAVTTERIYLFNGDQAMQEPTEICPMVGHIIDSSGPRSTLTYHESATRPTIEFTLSVFKDYIEPKNWARIWRWSQLHMGIGASRSQGFGKFSITDWSKLS